MTNKEFLAEVQKSCHLDMQQCLMLDDNLQKMLGKAAVDQIPVILQGLGVFVSHKHPEYIQEDAQTGAMTLYPPRISYRMCTDEVEDAVAASLLLAEYAKVSEECAKSFLDALVTVVNQHLAEDDEVEVPGLGVFRKVMTHQSDLQHLSYSPDEKIKELVNTPFSCFEPFVISEGKSIDEEIMDDGLEDEESVDEEIMDDGLEYEESIDKEIMDEEIMDDGLENEGLEEEEKIEPEVKKIEPKEKKKEEKEDTSNNYLMYASLALILLGCGFLIWLIFSDNHFSGDDHLEDAVIADVRIEDKQPEVEEIADTVVVDTVEVEEKVETVVEEKVEEKVETKPEVVSEPVVKEFHRMMGLDGQPKTVTLQPGERLTLVALDNFGDKAFWPYVFEVNKDKLKAPNLVQVGMKLYLPDPEYYHIDVNDPESLRKAKNLGAQLLK